MVSTVSTSSFSAARKSAFSFADERRVFQVSTVRGNCRREILDLGGGSRDISRALFNGRLELALLGFGSIDLIRSVLRSVIAPFDVLLVGLRFDLALLDNLRLEARQELDDLRQRIRRRHLP